MSVIVVRAPSRRYAVEIRAGLLDDAGDRLAGLFPGARRAAVVGDRRVLDLHGRRLLRSLGRRGIGAVVIAVPPGEREKNLARAERICGCLLAAGADRGTPLVALGGGVIGDLAGFVAATYMRGMPLVQVPTTLLAQVDASVGGKVAVNHAHSKNLIGVFYQPWAVLADPGLLRTLPRREFRSGLAECVKCGVIRDPGYFQFLERHADHLLEMRPASLVPAIASAVKIKADIVERDERDRSLRMLLNYGHTVGHAIEAATRFRKYRHGEAIAIGMTVAARIAADLGRIPDADLARQTALLTRFGLPVRHALDADRVMRQLRSDKKRQAGSVPFVLPSRWGEGELVFGVPPATVKAALRGVRIGRK